VVCLDTSLVIAFLHGRPRPLCDRLLRELEEGHVALPAPALFELQYGAAVSRRRAANEARLLTFLTAPIEVLAFDEEDAREAGDIRAALERAATALGACDLMIAAQARRRDAVLATAQRTDFSCVPGLRVETWAEAG
jgi:tRNA(fMet)-specific endonuclease VapC